MLGLQLANIQLDDLVILRAFTFALRMTRTYLVEVLAGHKPKIKLSTENLCCFYTDTTTESNVT